MALVLHAKGLVRTSTFDAPADSNLLVAAKILAVDDEIAVRKLLTIMLNQQGISCKTAENATEALEILQHEHVDAVISDLRMSGTSGMELLRHLPERRVHYGDRRRGPARCRASDERRSRRLSAQALRCRFGDR